jgi:ribokinase
VPPRIAVVGSVNLDLVVRCDHLPQPGETVLGDDVERIPGGKGANQALAARRLGAEVRMVACVGEDDFAPAALATLSAEGVGLARLARVADRPTGAALIIVDRAGENVIAVGAGANDALAPEHVDVSGADAVMTVLEVPGEALVAAVHGAEGLFCLNAAPARPVPREVVERADLVIVNRHEYEALDKDAVRGLVALTLGAEGAVLLEHGVEVARAAPPRVEAVDGTAAGDAFCAALVVSLLEGRDREEALRRACAAGALAASRRGAQPSLPTAAELDAIIPR